jgi:hypothetical protein
VDECDVIEKIDQLELDNLDELVDWQLSGGELGAYKRSFNGQRGHESGHEIEWSNCEPSTGVRIFVMSEGKVPPQAGDGDFLIHTDSARLLQYDALTGMWLYVDWSVI